MVRRCVVTAAGSHASICATDDCDRKRRAMIEVLRADGPDPERAAHLDLFGQFVGEWELDVTNFAANGASETAHGEWHFGWILQGRAVQDVWITPPRVEQESAQI